MSANEIKTYTALLSMGNGTAEQISKESDVSYSKIYEVLKSMEENTWVSSDDSRPAVYTVNSPASSIESVKRKRDEQYDEDRTYTRKLE